MSLRVAVVGLGWAARTIWLPRLAAHPDMTVTAVVDPSPAAREAFADSTGVRVLSDPLELSPDLVDLAIVAVPNHAHSSVAAALLRRGIPVFLEKPVCLSHEEADELARAEQEGGAVLIAGSAARCRTDIRALRQLAEAVGEVRHLRLAWVRANGVPGTDWFTRRSEAGGGVLLDLGWHLLDTALFLLGPLSFDQVVATTTYDFVNRRASQAAWREEDPKPAGGDAADVEDTARAFLVTESGVSVSLLTSWASHATHDRTTVEVHGSAGTAVLGCTFGFSPNRLGGSSLTFTQDGKITPVSVDEEPVGAEYDRQIDALAGLPADQAQRGEAVAAARRTIDVITRIYESAARAADSRKPEEVPA
ncbi:Gfo/Idh/MocA family oxidoreductase [Streptomyces parvus]|uniref:Gfo/Idh/MocA family protein n=1 Tax=Streptomyces parvus TaxID=66428 RepID=UPI0033C1BD10